MTIIASILFLSALTASFITIAASIYQNLPRILEVIENREVTEKPARKITIGKMVASRAPQYAALPILRSHVKQTMRLVSPQKAVTANGIFTLAA